MDTMRYLKRKINSEVIDLSSYMWYRKKVPKELPVKQVYGIAFSKTGKVILRVEDNQYKLIGGKPENIDVNWKETLKREYLEELNIEIEDIHYLGYLLVEENNEEYAQVRMIAKIKKIDKTKPDMDNGKIYQRFMANQENVRKYLKYKDSAGNQMIEDGIMLAKKKYHFDFNALEDEYFINS